MKISVIVPTYKPQAYLWECLDSIYSQTFPKEEYELLLVLNGCCEPYNTQIMKWMSEHGDMQMNFIQTDVGGVSNARNIALDEASGEYVAFIDDDDFVSDNYLNGLYEKATKDTIPLCYPYAFMDGFIENQVPYRITAQYDNLEGKGKLPYPRARKFFSGPCMKLIPMNFIHENRFDTRFKNGEDSLFMFLISGHFRYVETTGRDAVYYRRFRENSAVTAKRSSMERAANSARLITAYLHIYISNPTSINFGFLVTRILGAIRSIFQS